MLFLIGFKELIKSEKSLVHFKWNDAFDTDTVIPFELILKEIRLGSSKLYVGNTFHTCLYQRKNCGSVM